MAAAAAAAAAAILLVKSRQYPHEGARKSLRIAEAGRRQLGPLLAEIRPRRFCSPNLATKTSIPEHPSLPLDPWFLFPRKQMLISDPGTSCPSASSLGGGGGGRGGSPSSGGLIGGASARSREAAAAANNPLRHRGRSRSPTTAGGGSDTALHAMAIPARCALPCVDLLRQAYGPRRSIWGDLSPAETRRFYHELLPVSVYLDALDARDGGDGVERPLGGGTSGGGLATVVDAANQAGGAYWECFFGNAETLEQRARLASMARHAAKLYVRERCHLPSRVVAHLYDGLRHLKEFGTFRVTGMTWEELWDKYERKILAEDPSLEGEALKTSVCLRILEKSCSTSEVINNLSGCSELNTFLPDTAGAAAAATAAAATGPPARSSSSSAAGSALEDGYRPTLEQARVAESAAACAGALRLIPLIKPFKSLLHGGAAAGGAGGGAGSEALLVQKRAKRHARQRRMVARRRRGQSRRQGRRQTA